MRRTLIVFVVTGLTTAAMAATVQPKFADMDSNGNSAVSYAEFSAQWPNMTWETFRHADTNLDGHLDAAELRDFEAMLNWSFPSGKTAAVTK